MDAIRKIEATEPEAWAVWWGIGHMRKNSVHFERKTAEEVAAEIKSVTEIRPLYAAQTLASNEAELAEAGLKYVSLFGELQGAVAEIERLKEALTKLCRVFPTDSDMEAIGWTGPEIYTACNAYDDARAALTTTPQPTE